MGIIVGVFGESGEGKTTSNIVNPDGTYNFSEEGYKGMCPKSHIIINLDNKKLPIPGSMWSAKNKNYVVATNFELIKKTLEYCAKTPEIKSVAIDTINLYLAMKEFNERRKMSFDQLKTFKQAFCK